MSTVSVGNLMRVCDSYYSAMHAVHNRVVNVITLSLLFYFTLFTSYYVIKNSVSHAWWAYKNETAPFAVSFFKPHKLVH